MNVKKGSLTPTEEKMMELFWNSEESLGSREILEMTEYQWSVEQISNILRSLVRKQMIEFCGKKGGRTKPDGKSQPVRQFRACVTKGEYLANMIGEKGGVDRRFLYKVSAALVEEIGSREVISELENLKKMSYGGGLWERDFRLHEYRDQHSRPVKHHLYYT